MSSAVRERVWKFAKVSGTSLVILLALAEAGDELGIVRCRHADLMCWGRCSKRSVVASINELEVIGHLVKRVENKETTYGVAVGLAFADLAVLICLLGFEANESVEKAQRLSDIGAEFAPSSPMIGANSAPDSSKIGAEFAPDFSKIKKVSTRKHMIGAEFAPSSPMIGANSAPDSSKIGAEFAPEKNDGVSANAKNDVQDGVYSIEEKKQKKIGAEFAPMSDKNGPTYSSSLLSNSNKEKIKAKRSAEEKFDAALVDLPSYISREDWTDYVASRKSLKKPLNESNVRRTLKEIDLHLYPKGEGFVAQRFSDAISKSWVGLVFPEDREGAKESSHRGKSVKGKGAFGDIARNKFRKKEELKNERLASRTSAN